VSGDRLQESSRGPTFQSVHRGTFAGVPPTGRAVSAPLMIIYRISEGRIVEHWMQFDGALAFEPLSAQIARYQDEAPNGG